MSSYILTGIQENFESLLQSATTCNYKVRQFIFLQSARTCCYKVRQLFYYKVRQVLLQFYYTVRQVLQSASTITKCDRTQAYYLYVILLFHTIFC